MKLNISNKWVVIATIYVLIRERAFKMLKLALIEAPILESPNWDLPFEIMCHASDYAVGANVGWRAR